MGKFLKKLLGFILGVLVFAIVIAIAVLAWGHQFRSNYTYDAPEHIEREDGAKTIIAEGRGLYDENGDLFQIRGVNFGNLFVVEGWLSPYSMGAKMNEDGSYFKVNEDGIVEEYDEIYQEEMDALMAERFTDQQLEALNDAYFASFCTEYDFEEKNGMGFVLYNIDSEESAWFFLSADGEEPENRKRLLELALCAYDNRREVRKRKKTEFYHTLMLNGYSSVDVYCY